MSVQPLPQTVSAMPSRQKFAELAELDEAGIGVILEVSFSRTNWRSCAPRKSKLAESKA